MSILDSEYSMCMSKNGMYTKQKRRITRRIYSVRN